MSEPALTLSVVPSRPGTDLDRLKRLVLAGIASEHSRRAYAKGLADFLAWYQCEARGPLSKMVIEEYRAFLEGQRRAASTVNVRLSAVRRFVSEAATVGLLPADVASAIQKVPGARKRGTRTGNWLTKEQASALLQAPRPATLKGKRDRALLGLLIGCGLRRAELAALEVDNFQQRDGRWVLPDLVGKGGRVRTVPVPSWVKVFSDQWLTAAGIRDGKVFRAVDKKDRIWGQGITAKVVWWVVLHYAKQVGVKNLAPHDLRRTCAKLCRAAGGELEQIQLLLGHASVQTTEQYLGTKQNLIEAVNDRLGLEL
jgi:integrase/recombinase XerD